MMIDLICSLASFKFLRYGKSAKMPDTHLTFNSTKFYSLDAKIAESSRLKKIIFTLILNEQEYDLITLLKKRRNCGVFVLSGLCRQASTGRKIYRILSYSSGDCSDVGLLRPQFFLLISFRHSFAVQ